MSRTKTDNRARASASRIAVWTMMCQVVMQLSSVVTGMFIARILGAAGRGALTALLLPIVLGASVLTLGNGYSLIHFIPRGLRRETIAANVVWLSAAVGLAGGAFLWWVTPHWMAQYGPNVVHLARIVDVMLALSVLAELGRAVMTGREDYGCVNWLRVSQRVLVMIGYVICWLVVGFTLTGAVIVNFFVALVLGLYVLIYMLRGQRNAWLPNLRELARLQRYGVKVLPSTIVNMANMRLDQILMIGLVAPRALGLYSVSVTVAELLGILGSTFNSLLEGRGANTPPEEARQFYQKTSRITILTTLPPAILLSFCAERLILLVYGGDFRGAGTLTAVLGFGTIAQAFNRNTSGFLNSAGYPFANFLSQGIALTVTVILLPVLLRFYGVLGAAVASDIAYFAASLTLVIYIRRKLGYSTRATLVPTTADMLLLADRLQRMTAKSPFLRLRSEQQG